MRALFTVLRFFPYWALPVALILAEIGRHFRRRKSAAQWSYFGLAAFLIVLTLLWFAFRGDLYSDDWVRSLNP